MPSHTINPITFACSYIMLVVWSFGLSLHDKQGQINKNIQEELWNKSATHLFHTYILFVRYMFVICVRCWAHGTWHMKSTCNITWWTNTCIDFKYFVYCVQPTRHCPRQGPQGFPPLALQRYIPCEYTMQNVVLENIQGQINNIARAYAT